MPGRYWLAGAVGGIIGSVLASWLGWLGVVLTVPITIIVAILMNWRR